jgi:hypothetical protein
MEPECSLPSSQELSICTYPEPDQSSPQHSILSLKDPESNSILLVRLKTANRLWKHNAFTTAIQEAAWNSTAIIKTNLKDLNFPKEIKNLIEK